LAPVVVVEEFFLVLVVLADLEALVKMAMAEEVAQEVVAAVEIGMVKMEIQLV
jgi:hypothetical protein